MIANSKEARIKLLMCYGVHLKGTIGVSMMLVELEIVCPLPLNR
jgi:hypothetical protein